MPSDSLSQTDKLVLNCLVLQSLTADKKPQGLTSREIANRCHLGIYSARYTLLKLARLGYAVHGLMKNPRRPTWILAKKKLPRSSKI